MVVASIQAKADIKIAQINAETQKTLTTITANTSKYLADGQKEIALTQSAMAKQISENNNKGVTERLDMQLSELRSARNDAQQAERERREIDQAYNQQRIGLAQKQAEDNLQLAKSTLNAQLTQAGLSQGFSNSTNSGDRLGVARSGITGGGSGSIPGGSSIGNQLASAGAAGSSGLGIGASSTAARTTPGTPIASTSLASSTGSLGLSPRSQRGFGSDEKAATDLGQARSGATQLLRSVGTTSAASSAGRSGGGDADPEQDEWAVDPRSGKRVRVAKLGRAQAPLPARGARGIVRGRGIAASGNVVTVGRGAVAPNRFSDRLTSLLMNSVASGSTSGSHRPLDTASASAGGKSDLRAFLGSGGTGRIGELMGHRAPAQTSGNSAAAPPPPVAEGRAVRTATAHEADKPGKAYKEPELEPGGHNPAFTFPEGFSIPGLTLPGSQ